MTICCVPRALARFLAAHKLLPGTGGFAGELAQLIWESIFCSFCTHRMLCRWYVNAIDPQQSASSCGELRLDLDFNTVDKLSVSRQIEEEMQALLPPGLTVKVFTVIRILLVDRC